MVDLILNKFWKIDDFITLVKNKREREVNYMVYVPMDTDSLHTGMDVYIGDVMDFDEDENGILPPQVVKLGLEIGCLREQFQDAVDLAVRQKSTASTEEIIRCLNHYLDRDDFLDIE